MVGVGFHQAVGCKNLIRIRFTREDEPALLTSRFEADGLCCVATIGVVGIDVVSTISATNTGAIRKEVGVQYAFAARFVVKWMGHIITSHLIDVKMPGPELSTVYDTVGELNFVEMAPGKIEILGNNGLSIQPKSIHK